MLELLRGALERLTRLESRVGHLEVAPIGRELDVRHLDDMREDLARLDAAMRSLEASCEVLRGP